MRKLVRLFVEKSFLVKLITVFLWVVGGFVAYHTKRDLIPPFQDQRISVGISVPGASALDVERTVAQYAEAALRDLPFVKDMSVTASNGYCDIRLEYPDDTKRLSDQLHEIKNRLSSISSKLPPEAKEPTVWLGQTTSAWLSSVGILNLDPYNEVHREAVQKLKKRVLSVPGIVEAYDDMPANEFIFNLNLKRLEELGIQSSLVENFIRQNLVGIPVTTLTQAQDSISVELGNSVKSPKEIENLVIKNPEFGPAIRLSDLGTFKRFLPPQNRLSLLDGERYTNVYFRKSLGVDIINLQEKAKAQIKEFQDQDLPEGLEVKDLGDGASFVSKQIKVLFNNAWAGAFFILLVMTYFLGFKVAWMALLGVPLSYLGTALVMEITGVNINLISVISLILIVGILVDDAIVISEKYSDLIRKGLKPNEAAVEAAMQMMAPVTAGILTTMIAFVPILLVGGWLSRVLYSIPVVIISALAVSWFEAFFILPNHLARGATKVKPSTRLFNWVKKSYEKSLKIFVRFRYVAIGLFLAISFGTFWLVTKKMSPNFDLNIGSREVTVHAVLKEAKNNESTLKELKPVLDYLKSIAPEMKIKNTYLQIGSIWMDGKNRKGPRYGVLYLEIDEDQDYPARLEANLLARLKKDLPTLTTDNLERLSAESSLQGDDKSRELAHMYTLYFNGNAPISFEEIVRNVEDSTKDIHGFVSITYDNDALSEGLKFFPNLQNLTTQGMSERDLAREIRLATNREEVGQMYYRNESVTLSYSYGGPIEAPDTKTLSQLEIQNPRSSAISLSQMGSWKSEKTQNFWYRKNGERSFSVNVKFDPDKTRREDFAAEIGKKIPALKEKFPGYEVKVEESDKQLKENRIWMLKSLLYCLGGIFFILALQLGSFGQPLLIGLSIFYGFIGVLWSNYFHGYQLEIMAMIGLLGVAGVAVNDSIVMLDHINRRKASGQNVRDAISQGAGDRLQALILTSLTTLCGLFPMAYGITGDAGFTSPLAFSMAWGLLVATASTVYMIPVVLNVVEDARILIQRIKKKMSSKFDGTARPSKGSSRYSQKPSLDPIKVH